MEMVWVLGILLVAVLVGAAMVINRKRGNGTNFSSGQRQHAVSAEKSRRNAAAGSGFMGYFGGDGGGGFGGGFDGGGCGGDGGGGGGSC